MQRFTNVSATTNAKTAAVDLRTGYSTISTSNTQMGRIGPTGATGPTGEAGPTGEPGSTGEAGNQNALYNPQTPSHWSSPAPTTVRNALDRLVAVFHNVLGWTP